MREVIASGARGVEILFYAEVVFGCFMPYMSLLGYGVGFIYVYLLDGSFVCIC